MTYLATDRTVAIATQKIALNALAFLYNRFLEKPLGNVSEFRRTRKQPKLPTVLTGKEISLLFDQMEGTNLLLASLLYGSGLRRIEAVRLRVKDIDFDYHQIQVWNGKGSKHRLVTLPIELEQALKSQIRRVELYLENDQLNNQFAGVWMPDALHRKYPKAAYSLAWQYLFPSHRLSIEPGTQNIRRHHINESNLNKSIRAAVVKTDIKTGYSPYTTPFILPFLTLRQQQFPHLVITKEMVNTIISRSNPINTNKPHR